MTQSLQEFTQFTRKPAENSQNSHLHIINIYFFPKNILFCSTLGTTRMVSEIRGLVRWSSVPTVGAEAQSKLANKSSTTSVVSSRMPCKYRLYISSLTTIRLRGISRIDAKRRASSDVGVTSHYIHTCHFNGGYT